MISPACCAARARSCASAPVTRPGCRWCWPTPAGRRCVVAACAAVGIDAEQAVTESGATAVRTAFRRDLVGLAQAWTLDGGGGRGRRRRCRPGNAARRRPCCACGWSRPVAGTAAGSICCWIRTPRRPTSRSSRQRRAPGYPRPAAAGGPHCGSPAPGGSGASSSCSDRHPQVLLRTSGRRRGCHARLTARLRSRPSDRRRAECDRENTWRARREESSPSVDTGGHGDDAEGAARGGRWSGYDVTTGTSPKTDTEPTAPARKAGGGRRSSTPPATATGRPTRRLVIVESPTKAKKIAPYLGSDYVVESSVGHIRDLPRGAADVPAKYKGESWARLGVDVDNEFQPLYIVTPEKKGKVSELRDALKSVDELLLATDPDREGEAIAWHLLDTLKPKVPVRRMVFHEITEPAIRAAAANLRDLDQDLVDAQETRRILDRLYGYEVSPVLWKKVMPRLSAGRVQSVATRIIVQRERERMRSSRPGYWDIAATLDAGRRRDAAHVRRPARHRRRRPGRHGPRLRSRRAAAQLRRLGCAGARRGQRPPPRRGAARARPGRHLGRVEALHAQAVRAVHDLDAAAGGRPQAALLRGAHHALGPAAVRERLHHLHAYRLDDAVRVGDQRRPRAGPRALRRRVRLPDARGSTRARSRTRRRRTRPSARPARRSAPRARWPARSTATTSGSTS